MPQTENLRRAALITGGAKGIGRAICLALAENGMNIAVNYAGSAAAAEETAAACRALGVQAITLQADELRPVRQMVNASGAGDSFAAAMLYATLNEWSVEKTLDFAMAAGIAALSHERTINPNMSVSLLEDILEAHRI